MSGVKFEFHGLLLLVIFMVLAHQDESKASDRSDGEGLIPQMPTVMDEMDKPSETKLLESSSHFSKLSDTETKLKIHKGVKKVVIMNGKLRTKNKINVSNKRQVETRFKPRSDHKSVDNAGTVAFSADYRFPHYHPPKNN